MVVLKQRRSASVPSTKYSLLLLHCYYELLVEIVLLIGFRELDSFEHLSASYDHSGFSAIQSCKSGEEAIEAEMADVSLGGIFPQTILALVIHHH